MPSPCRTAFSTRLVITCTACRGRRAPAAGRRPPPPRTRGWCRSGCSRSPGPRAPRCPPGADRAAAGRCRCRATSRSSVISRPSRSASLLTVASISFFCSSLNDSQRLISVVTNPRTPVSGERSSCATVATRSERSRSSRSRPRAERSTTPTRLTGPPRPARTSRPVTSTSSPFGRIHDCSVNETRLASPSYGRCMVHHSVPSRSRSSSTSLSGRPIPPSPSSPSCSRATSLVRTTLPSASATTSPSGRASCITVSESTASP